MHYDELDKAIIKFKLNTNNWFQFSPVPYQRKPLEAFLGDRYKDERLQ